MFDFVLPLHKNRRFIMDRFVTTQIWFGNRKFSFGEDEEEGLMDFTVTDESEPEDYEGRYWYCTLSPDEMEYLAHRMLDAVDYYRKQKGIPANTGFNGSLIPNTPEANGLEPAPEPYAGESLMIANTLAHCNGDRQKAAERLRMSERTLYGKMKRYGLLK